MQIYSKEIQDGVAELVRSSASVAYCMPASLSVDNHSDAVSFAEKVKAESANPKQIDLYYIKSVLVSTGWNKNDDVFDPEATWSARTTPEDKQFNLMHDENNIIGHITGSYVVDRNGVAIADDTQPDDFDIITEAVLYNSWTKPENRERMSQIIAEIEEGKWFVSMECLFAGFDYALLDDNGGSKLLERNESSAFLTKHLRAYGGNGEYEGYQIGRCLRQISFSGKGLVSKPANPRSVILDASRAFSLNSNSTILTSFPEGDNDMSDTNLLEKQLAEMKSELASAKEENATLREQISTASEKEAGETVAKLEEVVAEKDEAIKALEASVAEKESSLTELQETLEAKNNEFVEKMKELKKMKDEKKAEARKAALLDLGLEAEEADESLASYADFDDSTFDAIISAMKKMDDKKKATVKEEEKEEAGVTKKSMSEEVEAEVEEAEAEVAAEEALEEVETTEATLVDASDESDELEATRASVAEWLENNVLSK
jgi:hypothetical protein